MKRIKLLLLAVFAGSTLISCDDDDDKFTGSPVGVLPFETVTATVSTDATFALPGQEINFTATLPESFRAVVMDTVTVQATIYSMGGGVRNASVDILPGSNSGTEKISVPGGGGTFDLNFDMKLTAINLKRVVPGKHYLLTSNTINVASGSTGVPTTNDKRLKISIDWENKTIVRKVRVKAERIGLTTVTLLGTGGSGTLRVNGNAFPVPFSTDLATTAANFVTAQSAALSALGVTATSVGTDLYLSYSGTSPLVTFTNGGVRAFVYGEAYVGSVTDWPKTYFLSASKLGTTSEGISTSSVPVTTPNPIYTPSPYAYNPGTYAFKIGVVQAADLEAPSVDLKYRIVVKFPNGETKIYNGVYNAMSVASGFKTVLAVTKTGTGDSVTYSDPVFTP
ncbi:MAG TPA: hypothetical protein PLS51_03605 [Flavobacterium sp.]|nr:hypothetical protein [Flavobacterium sp.]HPJ09690.1 hypothetical protein [Flavobacterium sp.]